MIYPFHLKSHLLKRWCKLRLTSISEFLFAICRGLILPYDDKTQDPGKD
jgi:hypothetical protein